MEDIEHSQHSPDTVPKEVDQTDKTMEPAEKEVKLSENVHDDNNRDETSTQGQMSAENENVMPNTDLTMTTGKEKKNIGALNTFEKNAQQELQDEKRDQSSGSDNKHDKTESGCEARDNAVKEKLSLKLYTTISSTEEKLSEKLETTISSTEGKLSEKLKTTISSTEEELSEKLETTISSTEEETNETIDLQDAIAQTDIIDRLPDFVSAEETNYLRFCHLIQKVAPQAVRHIFDQVFPPADLEGVIQRNKTLLEDLRRRKIISHPQWKLICHSGTTPLSSTFNITTMMVFFRHLTNIAPISRLYDTLPPPSDTSLGADLARIKYFRNNIAHCLEKNRKLDNTEYPIVWETASMAVSRIGGKLYDQECSNLRTANLDSSYMDIYREFLMMETDMKQKISELETTHKQRSKEQEEKIAKLQMKQTDPVPQNERDAETRYNRILNLLFGPCKLAVQKVFNQLFPPNDLHGILRNNESKIRNHCSRAQNQMLFSSTGVVSSSEFDLALIFALVDALVDNADSKYTTIHSDVSKVKVVRNKIAHNNSRKLEESEFALYSTTLLEIIERLGGTLLKEESIRRVSYLYGIPEESAKEELTAFRKLIPANIQTMDYASFEKYMDMLETGKEVRRDIRLIVVGKQGSGKSSLVARLLQDNVHDVVSTNGIIIHRQRRKVCIKTGKWIIQRNQNNIYGEETKSRLYKNFKKRQVFVDSFKMEKTNDFVTSGTSLPESNDSTIQITLETMTEHQVFISKDVTEKDPKVRCFTDESVVEEIDSIVFSGSQIDEGNEYACLTIWDFAGHKEFYDTHPIFLSPEAVYLVTTRLDEHNEVKGEETLRYWFDSIHYYGRKDDKIGNQEKKTLNPPVVAVGTFKDQCDGNHVKILDKRIKQMLGSSVSKHHLRSRYVISNTKDTDIQDDKHNNFETLRVEILKLAKQLPVWETEYPVVFIQLENCLQQKLDEGVKVLSFTELQNIAKDQKPVSITNVDNITLFLIYQHKIGNLIYFTDLPQNIFLDPQWLVDSFRCIISAEEFQIMQISPEQHCNFLQTGELTPDLVEKFFESQPADIQDNRHDIFKIMEKFDILVKPAFLIAGKTEIQENYYAPCVIEHQALDNIDDRIGLPKEKTSCLCYVFDFLPPPFINHLIIECIKEYPTSTYGYDGECTAIFKRMAIFEIAKTGCEKLVVTACDNTIQIQVLKYGSVKFRKYSDISEFMDKTIKSIQQLQYCAIDIKFEMKVKCFETKYISMVGMENLDHFKPGEEYYCKEHHYTHTFVNDWFQSEDEPGSDKGTDSQTSSDHRPTQYVNVNINYVTSDATPQSLKRGNHFSEDEEKFAKIAKISMNISADVLYDRLQIDSTPSEIREECDVSSLYRKHRKLNKYRPTKNWGGKHLTDIPHSATQIGDDIERIRLIRNELDHWYRFGLSVPRYHELCVEFRHLFERFDKRNMPSESYVTRMDKVVDSVLKDISEITHRFEFELTVPKADETK